jgi:nucleotide-binding universal stress UspA family protein
MSPQGALGPVVVGVTGSPASDRAVDWAADHAAAVHRRLHVVHAVGLHDVVPHGQEQVEAEGDAAAAGSAVVDAAVKRASSRRPDLALSSGVAVGDPAGVLLEHAAGAAAVVVGSSRDDARLRLHGSVGLAVVRHSRCPTVVVRPGQDPGLLGQRVVLGVDGTRLSRTAAEFAFSYASLNGLPLVLLHGSWERLARGSSVLALLSGSDEHGPTDEEELSIAETVAGLPSTYPDVEVRDVHRSSDPAKALIEASESARLVVVGARHLGAAAAMALRSVSTSLVEHAHCPVAVVHSDT